MKKWDVSPSKSFLKIQFKVFFRDVKYLVQVLLTFGVFFPSLATAFSVMAALEIGGRRRGGRGLLGWIRTLPWGDPSVTAQLLAMLTFVLGGVLPEFHPSFGVVLAVSPWTGLIALLAWLTAAIVWRYSSLSALVAFASYPLITFAVSPQPSKPYGALSLFIFGMIYYRHRENIKRLVAGTEPKIGNK